MFKEPMKEVPRPNPKSKLQIPELVPVDFESGLVFFWFFFETIQARSMRIYAKQRIHSTLSTDCLVQFVDGGLIH